MYIFRLLRGANLSCFDSLANLRSMIHDYRNEDLLTGMSVNFLCRCACTRNSISTSGRPSGGLACIVKQKFSFLSPSCYFSDVHFLAIKLGKINTYMPCDEKNMTSMNKFSKACASLKTLLHRTSKDGYEFIIIRDMSTDIRLILFVL